MESSIQDSAQFGSIKYPSNESYRMYLKFWLGQFVSLFGSAIVMFTIIWYMADLIGENNTLLSLVFFLSFLPQVIFSPVAGIVADRFDKRKIIILSDSLQALLTLFLIVTLFFIDDKLWPFFVLNGLRGICQAFHSPVGFTLTAIFVPKDKITRINGLNFLFQNIVNIAAAPIAVFLMLFIPLRDILWIDIITFGIALIPLLMLKFPPKETSSAISQERDGQNATEKTSFWNSFKEGFKTIMAVPGLINILIMATFLNFFFQPFDTLLINFIKYVHLGGEFEYSWLLTSIRIGVFIGAIMVSIKKSWRHWSFYLSLGLLSSGFALIAIVFIPNGQFFGLYITAFFIMLLNPVVNTLFQSLIQLKIPPEKMGRVISIIITVTSFMSPLGIMISGPIADSIPSIELKFISFTLDPIRIVFLACGVGATLMTILLLFRPKVFELLKEGERLSVDAEQEAIQEDASLMNENISQEIEAI